MLAIDAGNSNLTVARIAGGEVIARRVILRPEVTTATTEAALRSLGDSDTTVLSSVVPTLTPLLEAAATTATGRPPHRLTHTSPHGLRFAVPEPATTGVDRIAAACGALDHAAPPLIVVDCGTATTVTLIDRDTSGAPLYRGGAIAPGGGTALAALRERAPHLPEPAAPPLPDVGNTSATAIAIGALAGHAAMIDGLIDRLTAAIATPGRIAIFVTGGWARQCLPYLRHPYTHDPDLVLHGLAAIAARL
jgi:type III pantothenate kinase